MKITKPILPGFNPDSGSSFAGAFVGMAALDLAGAGMPAAFSHFSYNPKQSKP